MALYDFQFSSWPVDFRWDESHDKLEILILVLFNFLLFNEKVAFVHRLLNLK